MTARTDSAQSRATAPPPSAYSTSASWTASAHNSQAEATCWASWKCKLRSPMTVMYWLLSVT